MTEKQVKIVTKWFVDNSNRPLSKQDKEIIKKAVDGSNSIGEINAVLIEALFKHN